MRKAKAIQARLAPDPRTPKTAKPASQQLSFAQKLLRHPDQKTAIELVAEQAALEFDQGQGAELAAVRQNAEDYNARSKTSCHTLTDLEDQLAGTKRYLKSGPLHTGKDDEATRWQDWRRSDQVMVGFILCCLTLVLGMGMANVYANLVSSDPVFINNPWLAVMLSALLPVGSAAGKFVTAFMTLDRSRRRYALCVYVITLALLILWSVLFAQNFSGAAGDIDWDSFGESDGTGSALVWAQIALELSAGAALFLALEDVYIRYAPTVWIENPAYQALEAQYKVHRKDHEALRQTRSDNHARLIELDAARQAFINEAVAEFVHLGARFSAVNNPNFNL